MTWLKEAKKVFAGNLVCRHVLHMIDKEWLKELNDFGS
jgi:hypothetical protein